MDENAEARRKFKQIQKYISFLDIFSESLKLEAKTNPDYAKKLAKADYLLGILKGDFER